MKILLAVDGSEHAEGAAKFLRFLDLSTDDEIMIVHVINFVPFLNDMDVYAGTIYDIKQEIAPKILDAAVEILSSTGARLSTAIVEGDVDKAIIHAVIDAQADFAVLGAKGLKGVTSFITGSATRSVAIHAPFPVLAVKQGKWETTRKLNILFATDGSEYARAAGRFLSSLPLSRDSHIDIVNIVRSAVHDIPERFIVEVDDRMKGEVARVRTAEYDASGEIIRSAEEDLRTRYTSISGHTKVGDPSIEIIEEAERLGTDVIVVGCRGTKGEKGKLGGVARNILRHAQCSFLIAKNC